jgi:hypothetical protein
VSDYLNGGNTKQIADEKGLKLPPDYDKYQAIVELNDMKRGVRYDSVIGKEVPILNDDGEQVKYRSFEEAYRVKNYYDEISNARRQASKDIAKKLDEAKNGATVLRNEQVDQFTAGLTADQEKEIINWHPREYMNNPEKLELVKQVYAKRGLEIPQYRGRKI